MRFQLTCPCDLHRLVAQLTDPEQLEKNVAESKTGAVVAFTASWCPHSRKLSKALEKVAASFDEWGPDFYRVRACVCVPAF